MALYKSLSIVWKTAPRLRGWVRLTQKPYFFLSSSFFFFFLNLQLRYKHPKGRLLRNNKPHPPYSPERSSRDRQGEFIQSTVWTGALTWVSQAETCWFSWRQPLLINCYLARIFWTKVNIPDEWTRGKLYIFGGGRHDADGHLVRA